jgi:hypothetical protein
MVIQKEVKGIKLKRVGGKACRSSRVGASSRVGGDRVQSATRGRCEPWREQVEESSTSCQGIVGRVGGVVDS